MSVQIFIDRDPEVFVPILHYLRTKTVNCHDIDLRTLKHEAEFYGVVPLGELGGEAWLEAAVQGHLVNKQSKFDFGCLHFLT